MQPLRKERPKPHKGDRNRDGVVTILEVEHYPRRDRARKALNEKFNVARRAFIAVTVRTEDDIKKLCLVNLDSSRVKAKRLLVLRAFVDTIGGSLKSFTSKYCTGNDEKLLDFRALKAAQKRAHA